MDITNKYDRNNYVDIFRTDPSSSLETKWCSSRSFPFQHKYFNTETNGDMYKYDDLIN